MTTEAEKCMESIKEKKRTLNELHARIKHLRNQLSEAHVAVTLYEKSVFDEQDRLIALILTQNMRGNKP